MFIRGIIFLLILPLVEDSLYLYNTDDSLSVEFYDCITDTNLPYCRRPLEPIALQRDQPIWHCYHNSTSHSFASLMLNNISVSTILHQWNSSIEKAEEYSRYKKQQQSNEIISGDEKYLCECKHPQSFGKYCEYLLPMGTIFHETIIWEVEMRTKNRWDMHKYSDVVCYTTLICDYGHLCLDWRDICDGIQHCMFGYDEENCDKLEFNECEDDEYRCLNGMCIPDGYFLDGEYDCLDLSDEKPEFDDTECTFQQATYECDDRMCLRYKWSCGDGQCISFRFDFIAAVYHAPECSSLREQYHMCELHAYEPKWTLPNGKCSQSDNYEEIVVKNRTASEECIYFMKCVLSKGAEKNCPCKKNLSCINQLKNPCASSIIEYPNGAVIAPYAYSFYNATRNWSEAIPDGIKINGTIKCRGYISFQLMTLQLDEIDLLTFLKLEKTLCASQLNITALANIGYDRFCYNDSRTFNNRPYHFIDVCKESIECISAYRIKDGSRYCEHDDDKWQNTLFSNACLNIQRHRFRCSNEELTCLPVNLIGDRWFDCQNKHDEWWMGGDMSLSEFICDTKSKSDCRLIRQYIEASATSDANNTSNRQFQLSKTPFRFFCDTFWDLGSQKDEDIGMCQRWWKCLENQWQCRSGQCIKIEWVLDGEWDCVDASDEQGLFVSINNFSTHNLNLIDNETLIKKFDILYSNQSFWKICNLSMEYPCYRANVSDLLNITQNRPCINLHQIGDGHIDCVGGVDERNILTDCDFSSMLGYNFQCSSTKRCVPYSSHHPCACDDNCAQYYEYEQTSNCSETTDFLCLDGKCAKGGWCNKHVDCSHGEDELFCREREGSIDIISFLYREDKKIFEKKTKQKLQLPQLPIHTNGKKVTDIAFSMVQSESTKNSFPNQINSSISYYCNRGIGVQWHNGSIACFCPPQYYGDKCQFHNDRITFLFHLNLSQSIYTKSNNLKTMLRLLIIFLNEDNPLMIESFQTRATDETMIPRKKLLHLLYSRSNASLHHKRSRYFNRSNIINKQPYSVRIEAYQLNLHEKAGLVAVWLYPIYFDFLPSFRLTKVLYLTKTDTMKNPCSSNPCSPKQECHQILNQNSTYVCLCPPNFKGDNCSIIDEMCKEGFCSANALCKPNYRGLLSGNERPYCICPLNEIGHRCDLIYDKCHPNPCQNNGTCISTTEPSRFFCLCDIYHYGDECQLEKRSVRLYINKSHEHQAAVVQYFDINFFSLNLILVHQRIYINLPDLLNYLYDVETAPGITVVKLYSNTKTEIYLLSIQIDVESINGTTEVTEVNRCAHVHTLFERREEISALKYHQLCIQNLSLLCFVDESYLCICDQNHSRTECFGYDHDLDQCFSCLGGGQCLKEDQSESYFLCLCPRCYYGSLCQYSIVGISFTLDSLMIRVNHVIRIVYLIFVLLIFVIGGVTNYASIITFKRPNLRKCSMGIYLLILSIINQYSLFSLMIRMILILFDSLMNDISCKIISYMLSVSIRCSFWLTSWIAIERVCYVLFPFVTVLKKPCVATIITFIILLIVGVMHVYELIFYMKIIDLNGQSACVVNFPLKVRTYDRISVLIHYLIPFCIQILSITILIILAARSRSRTGNRRDTFIEYLKRQFKNQKELYITPSFIILSGLPQTILSFSFACLELVPWQQHALLIAYFLSFAPQLLGFVLFVLPSTSYIKEFQATKLSKTILFRWIISNKKNEITK